MMTPEEVRRQVYRDRRRRRLRYMQKRRPGSLSYAVLAGMDDVGAMMDSLNRAIAETIRLMQQTNQSVTRDDYELKS